VAKRLYSRRYAQAVFEIARDSGELEKWRTDLSSVAQLSKNTDLMALFESPKIRLEDKANALRSGLTNVSPLMLNLVYLLTSRGRLSLMGGISDDFQRLYDNFCGIEQAEVTTAVPLANEDKQRLTQRLKTLVGKEIVLKSEVNPSILGGLIIRLNDKLMDGSTRSRLMAMKRELAGEAVK
jgi:F-type H+-transporting ATPase subunit delta